MQTSSDVNFSGLNLNIRSIVNKYEDFLTYLDSLEHKFSVIGLTETWQNNENTDDFPVPQYCFTGKVRQHKQGGGVGLYVNQSDKYKERNDLALNVEDIKESTFIELSVKPDDIIIGIIYRPPNDKFEQFKVAPYSFMTTCVLMMRASVICARSYENVGFS